MPRVSLCGKKYRFFSFFTYLLLLLFFSTQRPKRKGELENSMPPARGSVIPLTNYPSLPTTYDITQLPGGGVKKKKEKKEEVSDGETVKK